MGNKQFTVRSTKTGEHLVIEGNTLSKALKSEGLNPDIWKPIEPIDEPDSVNNG